MSTPNQKILLCSLWQRTSERGNEYLSGFLGKARIIAFRGEPMPEGILTWDVYLSPGKQQEDPSADRTPRRRASAPRRQAPAQEPAGASEPFHNDDISDIGTSKQ